MRAQQEPQEPQEQQELEQLEPQEQLEQLEPQAQPEQGVKRGILSGCCYNCRSICLGNSTGRDA